MRVVDGATGADAVFLPDIAGEASPVADRVCFPGEKGRAYRCAKVGSAQLELLGPEELANGSIGLQFDDTGKRAMYEIIHEIPGSDRTRRASTYCVAGLPSEAPCRQPPAWVFTAAGSLAMLLGRAWLIATGSGSGVEVFDLDAGTKLRIPGRAFFTVKSIPGRPRALLVFQQEGSSWKAWLAELPP